MATNPLQNLQTIRENLPWYAENYIKIRSKDGTLTPFKFNKAQWTLHNFIESIRAKGEPVRVAIVKGRQQGCCYSPEMRVLTSDYRWVPIKDLAIGDSLFSVDENLGKENAGGRQSERRIQTAILETKVYLKRMAYKITLDSGVVLKVTGEHRHLCRKRSADDCQWREVSKLRLGDVIRTISHRPDEMPIDFEDGWFSGILDGEGSFSAHPQVRISIAQTFGPVLDRIRKYLVDRGINFYESIDNRTNGIKSKLGNKPVCIIRIDRMTDILRVLCRTQPARFKDRPLFVGRKLPKTTPGYSAWARVVSIESLGEIDVVDLQTSTKTFICEGVVSHNSTYVGARFLHRATLNRGVPVFILAHLSDSTEALFKMVKRMFKYLPEPLKPIIGASNRKELQFPGIDSEYSLGTAGSESIGRGTTPLLLHLSEAAYFQNTQEISTGLMQGVPMTPNSEIIVESTANGPGNMFYNLCMKGADVDSDSRYRTLFLPWFWQDEYTAEPKSGFKPTQDEEQLTETFGLTPQQLAWRRFKVNDEFEGDLWRFKREYPCSLSEAFTTSGSSLIRAELVDGARKNEIPRNQTSARIMGVDGADSGDRTVITLREGKKILYYRVYRDMKPMRLAGIVAKEIDDHDIDMVFLDVAYGYGCRDRLKELGYGHRTQAVHFGEASLEPELYRNKRAQMYGYMKDWFEEGGCDIPDSDEFAKDLLMIPAFKHGGSRALLQLPSKEDIKKENKGISPDIADALALTFAYPVRARGARSAIKRADEDTCRVKSPFKSTRLRQSTVNPRQPSELFV